MPKRGRYGMLNKIVFIIIFIIIIYIISPFLLEYYKKNGARKLVEKFSPKGRYKVEYYIPLEYKYILFPVDSPFFVKVYDFKEKRYIYESDFHEMGQGTYVSWPIRGVQKIYVGTNIGTHDLELE